jgi:hypothetical protein
VVRVQQNEMASQLYIEDIAISLAITYARALRKMK